MNITVVTIHFKYKLCEPKFFNKNLSKTGSCMQMLFSF